MITAWQRMKLGVLLLAICFICPLVFAAAPVLDQNMAREVALLDNQTKQDFKQKDSCHFDINRKELPKTDPYGKSHPHEVIVSYQGHTVFDSIEPDWVGITQKVMGASAVNYNPPYLPITCVSINNYRYFLFDARMSQACLMYKMCDAHYVALSKDNGVSWSAPQSVKVNTYPLGDENSHLMIGELNGKTYLFDPMFQELGVFKSNAVMSPFSFYEKRLYFIEEIVDGNNHTGQSVLSESDDYGAHWKKVKLGEYITSGKFFKHGDGFYLVYSTPCRDLKPCSALKVMKIDSKDSFQSSQVLIKTAGTVLNVFDGSEPLIVWQDLRFYKLTGLGIPWSDSPLFTVTHAIYAGHLDMQKMFIDEALIEYGDDRQGDLHGR